MRSRIRTYPPLVIAACAIALAAPAGASAGDYCVGSTPFCVSANNYPGDTPGFLAARAAATGAAGADRIFIAPGNYDTASTITISESDTLEVIGSGQGETVFRLTGGNNMTALSINFADSASEVRGLSLQITGSPTGSTWGLQVANGKIRNVAVADLSTHNTAGVVLGNATTVIDTSISMNSNNDTALSATSGNASFDGISIKNTSGTGGTGLNLSGSNYDVKRSVFRNLGYGIDFESGNVDVTDSLFDLGAVPSAIGMYVGNENSGSTNTAIARLARSTIVGSGAGQRGVWAHTNDATDSTTLDLFNDLFDLPDGSSVDFDCDETSGGSTTLTSNHTGFQAASNAIDAGCSTSHTAAIETSTSVPEYINAADGDFRPTWESPYVDAGDAGAGPAPGTNDLSGGDRVVDGDGNAAAMLDVGAYEYQRAAPVATANGIPASVAVGQTVSFSGDATDLEGEAVTYGWSFDDGATATGTTTNHAFATAGTHTGTITATDVTGRSGSATATITVRPPSIAIAKKPKKAFSKKRKGFKLVAQTKAAAVGLTIADATSIQVTLHRVVRGKRKKIKGTTTLAVVPGAGKLTFGGRFGAKGLAAGTYRVTLKPIIGGVAGKATAVNLKLK